MVNIYPLLLYLGPHPPPPCIAEIDKNGKKTFQIGFTSSFSSFLPGTRDCQSPGSLAALECPSTKACMQAHISLSLLQGVRQPIRAWIWHWQIFTLFLKRCPRPNVTKTNHMGTLALGAINRNFWTTVIDGAALTSPRSMKRHPDHLNSLVLSWIPFLYHETHFCGAWRHQGPCAGFPLCALAHQSVGGMVEGKGLGKQSSHHDAQCLIRPFKMRILHPA